MFKFYVVLNLNILLREKNSVFFSYGDDSFNLIFYRCRLQKKTTINESECTPVKFILKRMVTAVRY